MKEHIRLAQRLLNQQGAGLTIDGVLGPETIAALSKEYRLIKFNLPERKMYAYIQLSCSEKGIDPGIIDGYYGPQTDSAIEQLKDIDETGYSRWSRPQKESREVHSSLYPRQLTKEFIEYYGDINEVVTDNVDLPYPMVLSWDRETPIRRIRVHQKLAGAVHKILEEVRITYKDNIPKLGLDVFGGCYNRRKMRGGNEWSIHSWAAAIDFDPNNNRLRQTASQGARFAGPEYETWWKIWEAHGWVSLGRESDFDWMHIQAARL